MLYSWLVSAKVKQKYTDKDEGIFREGLGQPYSGAFNFWALQCLNNGQELQNVSKLLTTTKRSIDPWTTPRERRLALRKEGIYFVKWFEMIFIWKTYLVFHSLRKYIKIYSDL